MVAQKIVATLLRAPESAPSLACSCIQWNERGKNPGAKSRSWHGDRQQRSAQGLEPCASADGSTCHRLCGRPIDSNSLLELSNRRLPVIRVSRRAVG